jgi:hypothetical protein
MNALMQVDNFFEFTFIQTARVRIRELPGAVGRFLLIRRSRIIQVSAAAGMLRFFRFACFMINWGLPVRAI